MADATKGHRQRLKERFLAGEERALSDEGLLELLLTYAIPQKDVRPLAEQLLAQFGDLRALLAADTATLCEQKGIGEQTVTLLKLVNWIGTRHPAASAVSTQVAPEGAPQRGEQPPSAEQKHVPKVAEDRPRQGWLLPREATDPVTRRAGLFSNAALKEAIALLPLLPPMRSLAEVRAFLKSNLHFSAAETRERYAGYIARRLFPAGEPDAALRRFAHAYAERSELKDVCFYRFCVAEPIMYDVAENVLIPAIGAGQVARQDLRAYLAQRFPGSRNVGNGTQAIAGALTAADIAKSAPGWLRFGYREVPSAAFAFVLHSEFPSGMYDVARLEQNRAIRAMLWHPDRLVPALYELRNARLISKISEIDGMRQFTTRLTLEELVDELTAAGVRA